MTAKTKPRTYLKSGARVRIWKFTTAMFVALACAALLYWHDLTVGPILATGMLFFALLTALAAWSASVSIQPARARLHKMVTNIAMLTVFMVFVVLPLIAVGLTWGWFAVACGALLVYPILFVLLVFAGVLKYESWDFGDENRGDGLFYDNYGMMLGPHDATEAGDNLLASHLWADDD